MREEFEKTKTFKQCWTWTLDFDETSQRYFSLHPTYMSDAIAINAAWVMFQELKDE